ncbi:MAG TPA: hypothetical protein PKW80_12755 [Bacteroidales bacterium]|nr:hypothetical protein [Bacteroidales bacterium]
MKNLAVLFFCVLFTFSLPAQDTVQATQQEKSPKVRLSGFGGLISETFILKKQVSEALGAGGALMINNYFFLGAYGLTTVSNHTIKDLIIPDEFLLDGRPLYYYGKPLRINFGHAGIWLGGIFYPGKRVHFGISSRFGWGNIHLTDSVNNSYINNVDYRLEYTNDKIFVISPRIELEINITSWLKTNIGLGYNFVTGIGFDRYKDCRFSSPQLTIGLYFGGFTFNDDGENIPETEDADEY